MKSHPHLIGLLLFALIQTTITAAAWDEVWLFGQLRMTMAALNDPEHPWDGDTATGVAGHPEIAPTDPLYSKVSKYFIRDNDGLILEPKHSSVLNGKLVWWDVDHDGIQEMVFAGGASPSPYSVILKTTNNQWQVWQEVKERFLTALKKDDQVVLISTFDGYGMERDRILNIKFCNPRQQTPTTEVVFRWVGDLKNLASAGSTIPCSTIRTTKLRTSPEVNNTPEESGMGFNWLGNLYQTLAMGSSGWTLNTTKNQKHQSWSLVVFPSPAAVTDDKLLKAMITPQKVDRPTNLSTLTKIELMLGWVPTNDLNTH